MAIIDALGLQVRIVCDSKPCPEYGDDPEDGYGNPGPHVPACHIGNYYIESREDQDFAIEVSVLPGTPGSKYIEMQGNALLFHIIIDGDWDRVQAPIVDCHQRISTLKGVTDFKQKKLHKFRFAALSIIESADRDRIEEDTKKAKDLGLIRIVVQQAVKLAVTPVHSLPAKIQVQDKDLALVEIALKGRAVSLGTSISSALVPSTSKHMEVRMIDTFEKPYAVFSLKYRTREDLVKMMIIRSPTPQPAVHDDEDPLANLTRDEIESLARQKLQEQKNMKRSHSPTIKAEDAEKAPLPPPHRPYKRMKMENGTNNRL